MSLWANQVIRMTCPTPDVIELGSNSKETGSMKLNIYWATVLWHPNLKQEESGEASRVVVQPTAILAKSEDDAKMQVGMSISDEDKGEPAQLEVLVRPF